MIEFNGIDVVVENRISDARICRALASALGIVEERIAVIDDIGNYPSRAEADVVCVASSVGGEFSRLLSVQAANLELPYESPLEAVQRICDILDTRCLVPDEGPNPYCMWLMSPGAMPREVALDPVAYDDDRYVVETR